MTQKSKKFLGDLAVVGVVLALTLMIIVKVNFVWSSGELDVKTENIHPKLCFFTDMRVQPGSQLVVSGWLAVDRGRKAVAKFQFPRVVNIYDKRWTGRKAKLARRTTSKKDETFRRSSHLSCSLVVHGHHNFVHVHLYMTHFDCFLKRR